MAWRADATPSALRGAKHPCSPRPNDVRKGHGVCGLCGGNARGSGPMLFRERLARPGATLIEPEWFGSGVPHRVICANDNLCRPTPANVSQGHGVCLRCRQLSWTAFYVVTGDSNSGVKFGITNPPLRRRIREHARAGYDNVPRLIADLPGTLAEDTERAVRSALMLAGETPIQGREYFDASCLGLILDVADSWLARAADTEDYAADSDGQLGPLRRLGVPHVISSLI